VPNFESIDQNQWQLQSEASFLLGVWPDSRRIVDADEQLHPPFG